MRTDPSIPKPTHTSPMTSDFTMHTTHWFAKWAVPCPLSVMTARPVSWTGYTRGFRPRPHA
jgi:hypothetical protein